MMKTAGGGGGGTIWTCLAWSKCRDCRRLVLSFVLPGVALALALLAFALALGFVLAVVFALAVLAAALVLHQMLPHNIILLLSYYDCTTY